MKHKSWLKPWIDWVRRSIFLITFLGNHIWIDLHTYFSMALGITAEMMQKKRKRVREEERELEI